jgi:hypothetical protein
MNKQASKNSLSKRKLICGVGINDAPYSTVLGIDKNGKQIRCPFYVRWKSLIHRCYSPTAWKQTNKNGYLKNAQYEYCTVSEEWHTFTNFKSWMESQDWEGNHLDKDILFPGNTVYGPDTCIFVPPHINTMLVDQKPGKYPPGVRFHSKYKIFFISIRINGKKTSKGCWKTCEEAAEEFRKFRYNEIIEKSKDLTNLKLKQALINYAKVKYGTEGLVELN